MLEFLKQPWPWYVTGPLFGLVCPLLLIMGNKQLGISSSLRQICAACFPANIPYFNYDWKKDIWNLFFAAGIVAGSFISFYFLSNFSDFTLNPKLLSEMQNYGISNFKQVVPSELFSWHGLLTIRGFALTVGGGFLIGFGTRYSGGCTSGHGISGLSNLQWPSLVATACFMITAVLVANFVLPLILKY